MEKRGLVCVPLYYVPTPGDREGRRTAPGPGRGNRQTPVSAPGISEERMEDARKIKAYEEKVKRLTPGSRVARDCLRAFWVGGVICCLGRR